MASTSPALPCNQKVPPSGFTEIVQSLQGDNPPCVAVEVPQELTEVQSPLAGTVTAMIVSTQLCQDVMSGITCIDMVTCSMSLVGLGLPLGS